MPGLNEPLNPPPPLPPVEPMAQPAVSAADKALMTNVRQEWMKIEMESCNRCDERWFDLNVQDGQCDKCRKRPKFQASNQMNPGLAPDLPALTQIEEMIISPVHALVSLYQVRGGQFKYSGHCCNFARDTAVFHDKVPLLPEECDIIIMRRTGLNPATEEEIHQDFRVRRNVIEQWLKYLDMHHPTFRSRRVNIDWARLNQLPVDASVHGRLRTVETQNVPEPNADVGPPQEGLNPGDDTPLFTRGFVPNVSTRETELEQLRAAAAHGTTPIVLTMPAVHGTPINEHAGHTIAIDAFPSLFPTGKADFNAPRDIEVTMTEWAAHLMRYKDGRFAQHPRFRYWALNTILRHDAKKASKWYTTTHREDKELTVADIEQMLKDDDAKGLSERVAHAAVRLPGSRPFWQKSQRDLIAQIRSPECKSPHVFVTFSSADVQWPDMHQHMPNFDPNSEEDAHSYRVRLKDLNENPAIASYYFQKRFEVYFEHYIKVKFKVKDFWWRYEWQHRGSSHIHGFLWLEDAPSIDDLDMSDPIQLQRFIDFWDKHVSTWHPQLATPPAAIHPSARLFNTLEDTKLELAQMLNRLQRHTKCTAGYCERKKKGTGEIFCRFGFPKECHDSSVYAKDAGREFPELHTRRNDELLNSYNPGVILSWRANIDFRPVINREAVIAYVAKYASKADSQSATYQEVLSTSISRLQDTDAAGIAYQKMLSTFAAERDVSAQETCHILLGCKLIRTSRQPPRSLCVDPDGSSSAVDFENQVIERLGIMERYKRRTGAAELNLKDVSLLQFATHYNWNKDNVCTKRGSHGAKAYIVNVWPRYRPDIDNEELYEKYCYARMILHHPFEKDPKELLCGADLPSNANNEPGKYVSWAVAYQIECLDKGHQHPDDTLPTVAEVPEQEDSDSESIQGDDEDAHNYQAEWMQEAGRAPHESVQSNLGNLGKRDMDLEYDWIANSPDQGTVKSAASWLAELVKESPNDEIQALPKHDYKKLKGEQREVFLQVMAYFKRMNSDAPGPKPPPLRINIDGTAGTGKSFLIWCITAALRELFQVNENDIGAKDPTVRLAPTGISAFGIRGWTVNFGLGIPAKEKKEFAQLSSAALTRIQTRWKHVQLLIMDEKSMIGRVQMGRCDRRLRQAFPSAADETLGGRPSLVFGDFFQLPPIGDTPLYSDKPTLGSRSGLAAEGRAVFESFTQSVTLQKVFRQQGDDAEQIQFRDALMRLREYKATEADHALFSTRFWEHLSLEEKAGFDDTLHLLPTREAVDTLNTVRLSMLGKPVVKCLAKHSSPEAKKASDDDAEGLQKEILLAEGARIMITRNVWTSKGVLSFVQVRSSHRSNSTARFGQWLPGSC
jgi:hypothetical protein